MLGGKQHTFADDGVCTPPELRPEVPDTGQPQPGEQQEACVEQCRGHKLGQAQSSGVLGTEMAALGRPCGG